MTTLTNYESVADLGKVGPGTRPALCLGTQRPSGPNAVSQISLAIKLPFPQIREPGTPKPASVLRSGLGP